MGLVLKDRVKDSTSTTGTGTITLAGAPPTGFQGFTVIGNGNTTYYTIAGGAQWEVGIGTYNAGTLTRDTVFESSNANAKVDFIAGEKAVFVTLPAEVVSTPVRLAAFFFIDTPPASQVLMMYTSTETLTFPANFSGSYGYCGTNPNVTYTMDVQKNGSTVGSVEISTAGAFTFTTTGDGVVLAPGDQLKVIAPATAVEDIANVSISFRGTY